ncbi:nose resistant to fluoxetine protein 6 [Ixodes scapularis]
MFACATKNGGLLNKFLSWNVFIPLSRLTYGIYLVHLLFHLLRMANTKTAIDVDEYLQIRNSIGTFGLSVLLAYLLYLTCEAPTQHLCKLLFARPKSNPVTTVSTTETTLK